MQLLTVASAAVLTITPVVQAAQAKIYNKCSFKVYLWSVTADHSSSMITLWPADIYNEIYQVPSLGGVSLKLSITETITDSTPITQFEYTLAGDKIWYDISNVNCAASSCPFQPYGLYMKSGLGCPTRSCIAGVPICTGAYNKPNDNENTLSCGGNSDISLYLCTEALSAFVSVSRTPRQLSSSTILC